MSATEDSAKTANGRQQNHLPSHPNGRSIIMGMKRPKRNDKHVFENVFPENDLGKILRGLLIEFLIKQEPRIGWARKSACDERALFEHPIETVASHQWGVAKLIMVLTREPRFRQELPRFDTVKAYEMALIHDVAELKTGDITPADGVSAAEKHKAESEAMKEILGSFPNYICQSLSEIYDRYENRDCLESKFVKDCDKLDFMINAFLLERQGFSGFAEFYSNTIAGGFSTRIALDLAKLLIQTRDLLEERNELFRK